MWSNHCFSFQLFYVKLKRLSLWSPAPSNLWIIPVLVFDVIIADQCSFQHINLKTSYAFLKEDAALPNTEIMELLCSFFLLLLHIPLFKHPRITVAPLGTEFSKNTCPFDDPFQFFRLPEQKSLFLFLCMTLHLLIFKCIGIACVHVTMWSWLLSISELYPFCYLPFP